MELVTNNANEDIKKLFEGEISVRPIAWRGLHFYWRNMGEGYMNDLRAKLHEYMPEDEGKSFMFCWGAEDVFILCRGVRLEPLNAAAAAIKAFYKSTHTQEDIEDYEVRVYDMSIAWDDFREFFRFREKEISKQFNNESIAREEAEIKMVYEEPKPNPILIREREERPGTTVMVVEDDEATLKLLCNMLKQFNIVRARDGREALEKYYEHAPDVVFMDIQLPHLNGWDVVERIYEHDKKSFVIMVTAHAQEDDVQKAIKLGVKGYVKKPFSPGKIDQCVAKFSATAPKHKQVRSVF